MPRSIFTRAHYLRTAAHIANSHGLWLPERQTAVAEVVTVFDALFTADSKRFDKALFHRAIHDARAEAMKPPLAQ